MKNKITKISLITLLFFIQLFAGAEILNFTGKSENGNIVLKWEVRSESNLRSYVIQRKALNGDFADIAIVAPKNETYYSYTDETAYKSFSSSIYKYRIKIVDNNGSATYTKPIDVTHGTISGIKQTWGSIKALFR